ncbi:dephospho-CoA kinase [Sphingomonas nostoxanthinifaciens]|uniref:dephospho-CoA kinase n=1 Tax=Sphingomonas nostoxanthinifaciens TaxID=2872652 RepID=UPI0021D9CE6E|nr:dephospho-CoA kinase [Sphingomonas nostoxanthinifaciens]UAK26802.1 dephospho-CoA kinase [Sphingomonas nostoxanthinifaciens]
MGKSTVATLFRQAGVPVFDADAEVRRLQGAGGALVAAIEALHPGTTGDAGVDRIRLADAVLGDKAALARLEAVMLPAVRRARRDFVRRHQARRLVVLDVPLLFEKGGWREVDLIAVVSASAWLQRRRVLARPGMTAARLTRIRALQLPDHVKRARADFVIPTGGTIHATRAAVRAIVACLARAAGR